MHVLASSLGVTQRIPLPHHLGVAWASVDWGDCRRYNLTPGCNQRRRIRACGGPYSNGALERSRILSMTQQHK